MEKGMVYSNLELLLEIKMQSDWNASQSKELLRQKLSAVNAAVESLLVRERERRQSSAMQEASLKPLGEMEDFRGRSFLPAETN